ncbi:MAG: protein kinase [Gemmatales bacterium]|nr:protein kinase [Gemmatales bacterium]MDW8387183.1 tubulin-like doman-containing protein [Gemmatales bacterium]
MPIRIETQSEPIPGYRLIERLGCGGFGEVWKAEAPGGLLKAIKFVYGDLHSMDHSGGARAMQELKALERIKSVRHPYILTLERCDIVDGQLVIVMELADRSLWDRFRECRNQGLPGIPRAELLGYLYEAAEALDFMNERYNLQHLDIKPQNLFLVFNHVKVADFGLVKVVEGTQASVTGGVTPVYAAPETLLDGQVTRYSDQYSLAIVYQEMLTGQRPFTGSNTRQIIMQRLQAGPNLSSLPLSDQPIVGRALSKTPSERFASCRDFILALLYAAPGQRPAMHLDETPGPPRLTPVVPVGESPPLTPGAATPTNVVSPKLHGFLDAPPLSGGPSRLKGAATAEAEAEPIPVSTRPEQVGDGVLTPSLVIGLGGFGLTTLQALRKQLNQHFANAGTLPNLRFLGVDLELEPGTTRGLSGDEILVTRLNRPANYLKPRAGMPPIDDWITQGLLYRIPRAGGSPGLRILGRLALVEHARSLGARLHRDLSRITQPQALEEAVRQTHLNLRSNWPRVFLVAHLGGSTGSGMLWDMAYMVRAQLKVLGFYGAEVVGILLLPPTDDPEWTDLALANTYAALTELRYFHQPGRHYFARLEERGKVAEDFRPPFSSFYLIPTPGNESISRVQTARVVADFLYRQMFTPLSRRIEAIRRGQTAVPEGKPPARTFGLHVQATPRRPVLRQAAKLLSRNLLGQWAAKGSSHLAALMQVEVRETMARLRIEPASLLEDFQAACTRELGESVPTIIARWVAPLRQMLPGGYPDPKLVTEALQQAESLLGTPEDIHSLRPSPVTLIVRAAADHLAKQASAQLVSALLLYLDRPGYRVAGAEEAIHQASLLIEGWLKQYEQEVEQATLTLTGLLDRLKPELADWERLVRSGSRARRTPSFPPADLISRAASVRYQQILHHGLVTVFLSIRGRLTDQIKDLRFCRTRFTDIQKLLDESGKSDDDAYPKTYATLLPPGIKNIRDLASRVVQAITPDQMATLDQRVQQALQKQFQPLAQLCLQSGDWPRQLQSLLRQEVEHYLEEIVSPEDAAELFLAQNPPPKELLAALDDGRQEAQPLLAESSIPYANEVSLLLTPNSDAGRTLAAYAEAELPNTGVVAEAATDEIVFYREFDGLTLEALAQLGPEAKAAYDLACGLENFTPHSRLDLSWHVESLG